MISVNPPKPLSLFHNNQPNTSLFLNVHPSRLLNLRTPKHLFKPISATATPSTPPSSPSNPQIYQPFRPPPSPLPSQFRSLDPNSRLEILRDRLGRWYEYAPLIPTLFQEGFTPSSIEEATGITGIDQNCLVVGAKVRDSLVQSKLDPDILSFFDSGGSELLYEIRLLNNAQRASAARYLVENNCDGREAQELARAMKDFPRRRGDRGWDCFTYSAPGDCLAYMFFRQGREHRNPEQRTLTLNRALEVAETEKAKQRILDEFKVKSDEEEEKEGEIGVGVRVPVVRLRFGEVAEAMSVVVLPSCKAEEGMRGVEEAPGECRSEGVFGVVVAEKGWKRWVVLPGWEPVVGLVKGVAVAFRDARVLPWKVNRWYNEEAVLVVVDRAKKEVVAEDEFYLVISSKQGDSGFKVDRGSRLKELGVQDCLGTVVLVVRPPKDEIEDQLADEDWE